MPDPTPFSTFARLQRLSPEQREAFRIRRQWGSPEVTDDELLRGLEQAMGDTLAGSLSTLGRAADIAARLDPLYVAAQLGAAGGAAAVSPGFRQQVQERGGGFSGLIGAEEALPWYARLPAELGAAIAEPLGAARLGLRLPQAGVRGVGTAGELLRPSLEAAGRGVTQARRAIATAPGIPSRARLPIAGLKGVRGASDELLPPPLEPRFTSERQGLDQLNELLEELDNIPYEQGVLKEKIDELAWLREPRYGMTPEQLADPTARLSGLDLARQAEQRFGENLEGLGIGAETAAIEGRELQKVVRRQLEQKLKQLRGDRVALRYRERDLKAAVARYTEALQSGKLPEAPAPRPFMTPEQEKIARSMGMRVGGTGPAAQASMGIGERPAQGTLMATQGAPDITPPLPVAAQEAPDITAALKQIPIGKESTPASRMADNIAKYGEALGRRMGNAASERGRFGNLLTSYPDQPAYLAGAGEAEALLATHGQGNISRARQDIEAARHFWATEYGKAPEMESAILRAEKALAEAESAIRAGAPDIPSRARLPIAGLPGFRGASEPETVILRKLPHRGSIRYEEVPITVPRTEALADFQRQVQGLQAELAQANPLDAAFIKQNITVVRENIARVQRGGETVRLRVFKVDLTDVKEPLRSQLRQQAALETRVGGTGPAVQAGMGIGERPAQGTLMAAQGAPDITPPLTSIKRLDDLGRQFDSVQHVGPPKEMPDLVERAGYTNSLKPTDVEEFYARSGDFSLTVEDYNGHRAVMNASTFLWEGRNKAFNDRIKRVGVPRRSPAGMAPVDAIYADRNFMEALKPPAPGVAGPRRLGAPLEEIGGVKFTNLSTVTPSQQAKFIAMVTDNEIRKSLRDLNIKKVVIEPPYKFSLSEQANVNKKTRVISISADAENPTQTVLHELGHVKFESLSVSAQDALRQSIRTSTDPEIQGYLRVRLYDEAIADSFFRTPRLEAIAAQAAMPPLTQAPVRPPAGQVQLPAFLEKALSPQETERLLLRFRKDIYTNPESIIRSAAHDLEVHNILLSRKLPPNDPQWKDIVLRRGSAANRLLRKGETWQSRNEQYVARTQLEAQVAREQIQAQPIITEAAGRPSTVFRGEGPSTGPFEKSGAWFTENPKFAQQFGPTTAFTITPRKPFILDAAGLARLETVIHEAEGRSLSEAKALIASIRSTGENLQFAVFPKTLERLRQEGFDVVIAPTDIGSFLQEMPGRAFYVIDPKIVKQAPSSIITEAPPGARPPGPPSGIEPPLPPSAVGPRLPSGRVPGGPRAPPLPPRPPPPSGALPPLPEGGLPSGRVPGGIGHQVPPPPRDPYQQVVAALEPEREPFLSKLRQGIPQDWYDRNFPLRDLQNQTGIPVRDLAQLVPGAQAAGADVIRRRYLPVIKGVGKDEKFLEQYMVLRRMEDILQLHPGTRLPGALQGWGDVIQAQKALAGRVGTERFAKIEQAAEELWDLNNWEGIQALRRAGILSGEQYQFLYSSHSHYMPFQRADFVDVLDKSFVRGRAEANLSSTGIKTLTEGGSERALSDPLRRLVSQPIRVQTLIARNKAARSIVEALEEMQRRTGEALVEYIEPKRAMNLAERVTGERLPRAGKAERSLLRETISYYEDGVKHTVEVPAIFGRVAKGLEAEPDNILLQVVRALNAPLRRGAVEFNPFFLPVNVLRDAMAAMFREKVFPFGPDYMAGLWGAIRKNALMSEAAESGALMSGIVETMKGPAVLPKPFLGAMELRSLSDALLLVPRLAARVPGAISGANIIAERGVRLGTFRQLRRQGLSQLEAAVRTRDVTVDFAKSGHAMRVINQLIPFSNAAVQGSALIVRTVRDHPARSAAFAAAFASAAVMERVNNLRFDTSDLIPDYEYTRNWVIQLGEGERQDGTRFPIYIKVPKGEIVGLFTFPVEAMFHLARQSEDRSAAELLLEAGLTQAAALSPVDPGIVPPVPFIQTGASLATGVDLFTGAPIVPRREEGLPPEQQFGPDTSATAVALGQASKVSPRLIEFAIRDYLAGAGQSANWLLSLGLEAVGWQRPEAFGQETAEPGFQGVEAVARTPGVSRFIGTRGTQEERRGWEQFRQAERDTQRAFNEIPGMAGLGIRLGSVPDSIGKVELTPAQRARYQTEMAAYVIPRMAQYAGQLRAGRPAERRKALASQMTKLKDQARKEFLRGLSPPPASVGPRRTAPTPPRAADEAWQETPFWRGILQGAR